MITRDRPAKERINDEMVAEGYAALLSAVPELTFCLSPEDGAAVVIAVYRAMISARP